MSKIAITLQLIKNLKSNNLINSKTLAENLGVKPRYIIDLVNELELAGFEIERVRGKYGGYRLLNNGFIPIYLTTNEKIAMNQLEQFLEKNNTLVFKDTVLELIQKMGKKKTDIDFRFMEGYALNTELDTIKKYYNSLFECIVNKRKSYIKYKKRNGQVNKYLFHPYDFLQFKNAWYVTGFIENEKLEKRVFKLNRFISIQPINEVYKYQVDYDINQIVNDMTFIIGEPIHVKLEIKNRYHVTEYVYGENQEINFIDDSTFILSVDMINELEIVEFILSMGSDCIVLEPENIREKVIATYNNALKGYKKRTHACSPEGI